MAVDLERLVVQLSADIKKYENALNKANGITNTRARQIESRFAKMNKNLSSQFNGVGVAAAKAFALIGGLQGFKSLTDQATRIDNALKVAGLSGAELESVYKKLFASAQRNAAPLETLVTLYGRAATVQKELGVSTEELLTFTDNVALALRVAGTDAQSASGALLQLSQALGAGVVRAEEFNSLLEGALPIVQAAAAGIKEAGGSVSKLRTLVNDGKVSSEAFFRGFEAGSVTLREKAAGAVLTIDQRLTNLRSSLVDAARRFNESSGAAATFGTAIDKVAAFINSVNFEPIFAQLEKLNNWFLTLQGSISAAGTSFGQFTGLENFGRLLTGGAPTKEYLGGYLTIQSTAAIRDRINQAFEGEVQKAGDLTADAIRQSVLGRGTPVTTAKTGRLPAVPTVTPVSLADFKVPGATSSKTGAKSGTSKSDSYESELKALNEQTTAINQQREALAQLNPLQSDFAMKVAAVEKAQELLTAAQKGGREVGKELSDVNKLLYGDLSDLTPAARQQAEAIRALAIGYADATTKLNTLKEAQDKAKQSAEDMIQLQKDVISGGLSDIRSALEDGKITWDEWRDIAVNALNKVADKLQELIIDQIFSKGLTGLLGGALGGATAGGSVGSGGFVSGGYTGPGGKYQPAGIVHKGEYVMDAAATRRIGVDNLRRLQEGYANGGPVAAPRLPSLSGMQAASGAAQGVHVTVGFRKDGLNLEPEVVAVSSRESQRAVESYRRTRFRDDVARAAANPRRRG